MIKQVVRQMKYFAFSRHKMSKIENLLTSGLPEEMKPALEYLVTGKSDAKTDAVVKRAEDRRAAIASQGDKEVAIWYSPKPENVGNDTSLEARPEPGNVLKFTMKRVAKTGKNQKWGTVIYLIAEAFQPKTVFELGTCAGISAIYLSSAKSVRQLITVEGSKGLAEIAEESLKSHKCAKVVNSSFDDAIDSELPILGQKVDFAFIDGHHEKVATIHYLNKLYPFLESGAVVLFDDISWSHDMREAWDIISKQPEFSHAIDLGVIGICLLKARSDQEKSEPKYWDLKPIIGKPRIGNPHGWIEQRLRSIAAK